MKSCKLKPARSRASVKMKAEKLYRVGHLSKLTYMKLGICENKFKNYTE